METTNNQTSVQVKDDNSGPIFLAILGGALLVVGIALFLWDDIASLNEVYKTLLAFAAVGVAHCTGFLLTRAHNYAYTGSVMHVVGMLLLPTAFAVYFYFFASEALATELQVFIASTASALAYVPIAYQYRRSIFTIFGTWSTLIAVGALARIAFQGSDIIDLNYVYWSLIMISAYIGYCLKPFVFATGHRVLYVTGALATVFFGLIIGAESLSSDRFYAWDVIYPFTMWVMMYIGKHAKESLLHVMGIVGFAMAALPLLFKYIEDVEFSVILAFVGASLVYLAYRTVQKSKTQ